MNIPMRRREKEMTPAEAAEYLQKGEYGVLSTISEDNTPYGVPLSYAVSDNAIYIHCAQEGHKLLNIRQNPNVCFTVVSGVELFPDKFNTRYKSVIVFGTAELVGDEAEKRKALMLISKKYTNVDIDVIETYMAQHFARTAIIKIKIMSVSGKGTKF